MIYLLIRRILLTVATSIAALTLVFALVHASGDPLDGFLAPGASDEVKAQTRVHLGLDDPLAVQYGKMLARASVGDFGESWRSGRPALETVAERLPSTLSLALAAIVVASVGGVALGVAGATTRSPALRGLVQVLATAGQAIPAFWLGTLGILLLAVRLGWLPTSGYSGPSSIILPALTLAAYPGSLIARVTMVSVREVSRQPYVIQAHAKGLRHRAVVLRHVLPNALTPALAVIGVEASFLVGGAILVESVFAYPGIGRLALQATGERDLPLIQAFVVIVIVLVSIVNLLVDVAGARLDPVSRDHALVGAFHG